MRQSRNQVTYTIPTPQQPTMQLQQNKVSIQPVSHSGQSKSDFVNQLLQTLQQEKRLFSNEELTLPSLHSALSCISAKVDTSVRWPPLRPSIGDVWSGSNSLNPCGIANLPVLQTPCSKEALSTIPEQDEDTLFLIWDTMPGTQSQELAASTLERMGWRYDIESSIWYLCEPQNKVFYYDTVSMGRKESLSLPPNLSKHNFHSFL